MIKNVFITFVQSGFVTILVFSLFNLSLAEVRNSDNFSIKEDSLNFGGGLSTSSKYSLESTGGELATGTSTSASYSLRAGYKQMHEVFVSLSVMDNVEMLPALGGVVGGISNGSTSVVATTDSASGYQLSIQAENEPAMRKGADVIDDYQSAANPDPDFDFNVNSLESSLGFSVAGDDVVNFWRNDGSLCNSGTNSTALKCWFGLSTTSKVISSGGSNHPDGTVTNLYFKVGVGDDAFLPNGNYYATTTLTAISL